MYQPTTTSTISMANVPATASSSGLVAHLPTSDSDFDIEQAETVAAMETDILSPTQTKTPLRRELLVSHLFGQRHHDDHLRFAGVLTRGRESRVSYATCMQMRLIGERIRFRLVRVVSDLLKKQLVLRNNVQKKLPWSQSPS